MSEPMRPDPPLHEPVESGPDDEDDFRYCGTCGHDLRSLFMCPEAPTADCGCPLYLTRNDEHTPGCADE